MHVLLHALAAFVETFTHQVGADAVGQGGVLVVESLPDLEPGQAGVESTSNEQGSSDVGPAGVRQGQDAS